MGYYRLLLAMAVLVSHLRLLPIDIGQSAVICFLLISGYVMTKLLDTHYRQITETVAFYKDRAARIFPQYLFYCALTLALVHAVSIRNSWSSACTPEMIAGNLGIYMLYDPGISPIYLCTLIPPAWSLSLEWAFYLVVPFIANSRSKAIFAVAAIYSINTYIKAYLGIIDTDSNGYRHLSGTLFMFLVGISFAREGLLFRAYRYAIWTGAVALFVYLFLRPDLRAHRPNTEVLFGLIVGIPALWTAIRSKSSKWESLAGNLSYGVFLNHFLLYLLFVRFAHWNEFSTKRIVVIAALSLLLSYVTYHYLEAPIMKWRRTLRKQREHRLGANDSAPTMQRN
jgi:peptidoglycan/LPS O-acetylase OafA/YrhL